MSDVSNAVAPTVVDVVDDGMTDDEIAALTQSWLDEVRDSPGVELPESAADALSAERSAGNLWPV